MEPIGCPETSVRNNHSSLRNNPEERSSHGYYAIFIGLDSIHYYKKKVKERSPVTGPVWPRGFQEV